MSVNGYFIGSEIGTLNADKFTEANIEASMRQEDLALMESKWFDYRLWHPAKATMYFASRYHVLAQEYIRKYFGEAAAVAYGKKTARADLRKSPLATIRGFWRARQMADAIGCTYEVYIRAMLDDFYSIYHVLNTTKVRRHGQKQQTPYAAQMYSDKAAERAIEYWDKRKEREVPMPESEYFAEHTPWFQEEMESYVRAEAAKWPRPESWIADAQRLGVIKQG